MLNWSIGIVGLFVLASAACSLARTPRELRSLEPSAVIRMRSAPPEAAHCIAALMDEEMRYGLLKIGRNNHVRLHGNGASVVSNSPQGTTDWLVDIEEVDGGSVAKFHVTNDIPLYPIKQDGRRILETCSQ